MISQVFPIISTPDLPRALAFYLGLLGGTVEFEYPDADGQVVYAGLDLGESHLGIGLGPDLPAMPQRHISLWVYTDDCDGTVERLRAAGTPITEEPADQPWGERVARVRDPDGNELIIGQRATG